MSDIYFIGLDVAKEKFDACALFDLQKRLTGCYSNNCAGIAQMLEELGHLDGFELSKAVFCMEHTGIYCNPLLEVLCSHQALVWMESAHKIKEGSGFMRGKNDRTDAFRIALYASKHTQQLRPWKALRPPMAKLKYLFSLRCRLVEHKKQLNTPVQEAKGYVDKDLCKLEAELTAAALKGVESSLAQTESAIDELIRSDPSISHQYGLLTSITSIGRVTAICVLILSNEFKDFTDARKFACYSGVAPFEHQSGKRLKGRSRVSHYANKTIKTLLHMASVSAIRCCEDIKCYYQRKLKEGKNKMLVLNAVRNKLIHRIFAVIRQNRPYQKLLALNL